MSIRRWPAAAGVVVLLAAGIVMAQGTDAAAPVATLRLASQTAWATPGGELEIRIVVQSSVDAPDLDLAVSVYPRLRTRSAFVQTVDGRVRGTPLELTTTPLSELQRDPAGAVVARLPIDDDDPATPTDRNKLQLRERGVYPVKVEIRRPGGAAVDALTTHLALATPPEDGAPKLRVAWVLPLHAPLALRPDGTRRIGAADADRVGSIAKAVDARPGLPLVLAPTPETIAGLAASDRDADRASLTTLVRLARDHQIVAGPFVPLSLPALVAGGLLADAGAQLDRGADVLGDLLQVRADPRTRVVENVLDETGLTALRDQQVDRLVLPDAALAPADQRTTFAQPFDLEGRAARRVAAFAADPGLASHFAAGDDPVLAAHHLLADLAMIYFESPGRDRGVVISTPRRWRVSSAFLDAALDGLAPAPILTPSSLDELFAHVPKATTNGRTRVRRLAAGPNARSGLPGARFRRTRARIDSFAGVLEPGNPLLQTLDDVYFAAESSDLRSSRRGAYLDGVAAQVDDQLDGIRMPSGRSFTLTARRAEIPITVLNEIGYPVRAVLRIDSDKLKLPDRRRDVELVRRNTTERFAVRALSSGTFPMQVRLLSPDGRLLLGRSRFTVRSTSASGVGIGLSVGAGVFLVVWWARHIARGRRNRRLVPA